ncbi:MAG: sterol desaturase family protein [Nannocystaceae bacterium]|nr:sterol desaturase family protein [bacterium]
MSTSPSSPRASHPRAPGLRLPDAARIFFRHGMPRILVGFAVYTVAYRVWVGGFTVWDLALVSLQVAFQPMTEWLIHVFVLHARPRRIGPLTLDPRLARDHRSHHTDPHEPRWWFIPISSGILVFVSVAVLSHLVLPQPLAATFTMTTVLIGLVYEWTHFLCHSSYKPRSRYLKYLVRHHRLHHFKNEHYWMGVTAVGGDRLLGTLRSPRDVPTSPSCRDVLAAYKKADKSPR